MNKIEMKYKLVPLDQLSNFERMCIGIRCPKTLKYEIMNVSGTLYINSENPHCEEIVALIKELEESELWDDEFDEVYESLMTYTHNEAALQVWKVYSDLRQKRKHEEAKKKAVPWYAANKDRFMDDDEEFMKYFEHEFLYELFHVVKKDMEEGTSDRLDKWPTERALEAVFLYGFEAGQACGGAAR